MGIRKILRQVFCLRAKRQHPEVGHVTPATPANTLASLFAIGEYDEDEYLRQCDAAHRYRRRLYQVYERLLPHPDFAFPGEREESLGRTFDYLFAIPATLTRQEGKSLFWTRPPPGCDGHTVTHLVY
ncbi:hypothetical protein IFR05_000805 [Cadophora sp. M221]|nr:hypothetical protein IFR05_000805 [Cadophora sp. M221]